MGTRARHGLFSYTTSAIALTAASAASNLAILRWLEPEDAGIWQTLTLAQSYLGFMQLGVSNGLSREFPYAVGQGDRRRAERLAASAQSHALLTATTALVLFLAAIPFFRTDEHWVVGLVSIGIVAAASFYRTYLAATYRSGQDFGRLGAINWLNALLLTATVPLVAAFQFTGLCIRLVTVALLVTGLAYYWRPVRVPPRWEWSMVRPLLTAGAPLLVFGELLVISNGFDRLILLGYGGVAAVGIYTPALALKNALRALPLAVNSYIAPRLSRDLGEHGIPRRLWGTSWRATLGSFLTTVPVAVLGWWAVPWAIDVFFPQYAAGTFAAQLLLVAGLLESVQAGTAALASLKAWRFLATYAAASVAFLWALPSYFGQQLDPVIGVATGWLIARALLFTIGLGCVYFATRPIGRQAVGG